MRTHRHDAMRHVRPLTHALAAVALFAAAAAAQRATPTDGTLPPPVAAKEPHATQIHGYTLSDDYFWLRRKSDPAVLQYLNAENAYTAAVMKPTEPL
jgi:oligopeptidase B